MTMSESEALASLKILVAVAQADGHVHDEERLSLEQTLDGVSLPGGVTLGQIMNEKIYLDSEIAKLGSTEARERTYEAAVALANADGDCSTEEAVLLEGLRQRLGVDQEKGSRLTRHLRRMREFYLEPGGIQPIADPARRTEEVQAQILRASIATAILGATPIPGISLAADIVVGMYQLRLARVIGMYYGARVTDSKGAIPYLSGLIGGFGARLAIHSLAKFIPGWGSAFGAVSSFATTWAIGRAAEFYHERGGKVDEAEMREAFKSAKKEGKKAYEQNKATVDAKRAANAEALDRLNDDLNEGRISREEYEKRLNAIG